MSDADYAGPVLPNVIFHLEDDPDYIRSYYPLLEFDTEEIYGQSGELTIIMSDLFEKNVIESLDKGTEAKVLKRLKDEHILEDIIDGIKQANGKPVLISMDCGVVARELIRSGYLPSAIITDTLYFLNGKKTLEWLWANGLDSYLPIGLSSTRTDDISPSDFRYYGMDDSTKIPFRYFWKGNVMDKPFAETLRKSREYHIKHYGIKELI